MIRGPGQVAAFGACIALVANAVVTGWLGLDFGLHWDEWRFDSGLTTAVKDFSLLPRNYTYGGVYFSIGFLMLAPYALPVLPKILSEIAANPTTPLALDQYPAIVSLQTQLTSLISEPSFLLTARGAFLAVSALGILWVFAAFRNLFPDRWWGALAAAGFVATSWEVAYHSRFLVPDAVMMQFTGLTFLLIVWALRHRDHVQIIGGLLAAAVAAGLTFGCKMTGVFMVVPVLTAALVHHDLRAGLRRRLVLALAIVLVFGLTYFVTTPGSVLDPIRYFGIMAWEHNSYQSMPDEAGLVRALVRCGLVLVWLFGVVPSHLIALAVPMSAVTLLGIGVLWRHHRSLVWCSAAFVLIHGSFMIANQWLLVRHWLVCVPLLGIAFGAGAVACFDFSRRLRLAWLVPVCLAGIFAYNVTWLWISAYSIRQSGPAAFATRLIDTMAGQPRRSFWFSQELVSIFETDRAKRVVCAQDSGGRASVSNQDLVGFLARENSLVWVSNRPWFYESTIGSHEINYDYYPGWIGHNAGHRIVVLAADRARKRNMTLDGYRLCRLRS